MIEVKSIDFGKLRGITSQEFCDSTGSDVTWDGLMDGTDVKLVLANRSKGVEKAYVYTVSRADVPGGAQWSWGIDAEAEPGAEKEINYVVPMPGISSADYRDYTGPLRYLVKVSISESVQGAELISKVKYYDIPASVAADELEEANFNIHEALEYLERTTLLHSLNIVGDPKEGIKSIEAKLLNFGGKTQYIGIDTRSEKEGSGCQTQFFYEVSPKEEISIDIGSFIPTERFRGMEYLRIKAVSIPEPVFRSRRARSRLFSHEKSLIAKFNFYFRE